MPHRKFSTKSGPKRRNAGGTAKSSSKKVFEQLEIELSQLLKRQIKSLTWSSGDSPPRSPVGPSRPAPGADATICHLISTFTNSSGLTGGNSIVAIDTTNTLGSIAVEIQDFPDSAGWLSDYDHYRFEKLHFRFTPYSSSLSVVNASSPNNANPTLLVSVDHDDSTAPTSYAAVENRSDCIAALGYQGLTKEFVPSITPTVFASGAFSGYAVAPSDSMWIDSANGAVPNYGVKFAVEALPTSSTEYVAWKVHCWATVSFKNNI